MDGTVSETGTSGFEQTRQHYVPNFHSVHEPGTLPLESHVLSRSTLYKFTINSQVRSFTIRYYFYN